MPIYVYVCDTCGFKREEIESIKSASDTTWPCGSCHLKGEVGTMRRVPALPAPAQFNCSMPTYQRPKS